MHPVYYRSKGIVNEAGDTAAVHSSVGQHAVPALPRCHSTVDDLVQPRWDARLEQDFVEVFNGIDLAEGLS